MMLRRGSRRRWRGANGCHIFLFTRSTARQPARGERRFGIPFDRPRSADDGEAIEVQEGIEHARRSNLFLD